MQGQQRRVKHEDDRRTIILRKDYAKRHRGSEMKYARRSVPLYFSRSLKSRGLKPPSPSTILQFIAN